MDEATQVSEARRRRSRAEIEQLLAEFEASELNRVEFCRQKGLSLATLARYRKRQAEPADSNRVPGSRWLAVEISGGGAALDSGASSGLVLGLSSGRRIEVGRGFDAPTLVQLLSVLERI